MKRKQSAQERAEVAAWEARKAAEVAAFERKHGSITQRLWERKQRDAATLRSLRTTTEHIPSAPLPPPEAVTASKLSELDFEEREAYLKREAIAAARTAELKSRTAPAYNKGPSVYYSDGMLDSIKSGSNRRRS